MMINDHELKSQKGKYLLNLLFFIFLFFWNSERKADDLCKISSGINKVHIPQSETASPFSSKIDGQLKKD